MLKHGGEFMGGKFEVRVTDSVEILINFNKILNNTVFSVLILYLHTFL